ATLKRYAASNNVIVKNIKPTNKDPIKIGTVKLNDQNSEMTEIGVNSGLRFFGGTTNSTFTQVMYLRDLTNMKTIVVQTQMGTGPNEDSSNKNPRDYTIRVLRVFSGNYTANSPSFPSSDTAVPKPGEMYVNAGASLFRLGVSSTLYNVKPFYDDITFGSITLNIVGEDYNSSFELSNPIAKGGTNGVGTYVLDGTTRSPSGLPRNINTLTWTSAGINSNPGYTLYDIAHNIGVWFTDGTTTV
ncbi:hypothetical protein HMPREF0202_02056, partial [Cetobacterium somerae ATCC BAA-474]